MGGDVLFSRALLKLSLPGRIRPVDLGDTEPSSFYITREHFEWVILAGLCLVRYAMALGIAV